jgi:hypothetical protein
MREFLRSAILHRSIGLFALVFVLIGCTATEQTPVMEQETSVIPTKTLTLVETHLSTATEVPTLIKNTPTSENTSTLLPPSITSTPAPVDRLLEWQALRWPNFPIMQPWDSDGNWLVTIHKRGGTEDAPTFALYARRITDGLDSLPVAVFQIPQGQYPVVFETGSGLETAGGRAAVLLAPRGGDDPHGYDLMLIDLESGRQRLLRHSDRALLPAFPAIAMSADWLALKDLNAEGKDCIEVFHLPEGETRQVICPPAPYPEVRVQWPALGDGLLAYIQYESTKDCASVHRFDLTTGQDTVFEPETCRVGLMISVSDHLIVWTAVSSSGKVTLQGDADGQPFELDRSTSGMPQVCGRRVYFLVESQGAMELRAWQPGLAQEVLHRFRPLMEIMHGPFSNDNTLAKYNVEDWRCGGGWLLFFTGDIYVAQE